MVPPDTADPIGALIESIPDCRSRLTGSAA